MFNKQLNGVWWIELITINYRYIILKHTVKKCMQNPLISLGTTIMAICYSKNTTVFLLTKYKYWVVSHGILSVIHGYIPYYWLKEIAWCPEHFHQPIHSWIIYRVCAYKYKVTLPSCKIREKGPILTALFLSKQFVRFHTISVLQSKLLARYLDLDYGQYI